MGTVAPYLKIWSKVRHSGGFAPHRDDVTVLYSADQYEVQHGMMEWKSSVELEVGMRTPRNLKFGECWPGHPAGFAVIR